VNDDDIQAQLPVGKVFSVKFLLLTPEISDGWFEVAAQFVGSAAL
jgi:hypothetical protein